MVALRRGVPPEMLAAMQGTFYPVLFVHLDWPGDPVRAHSGVGVISWGGYDWTGVGDFGDVAIPDEAAGSMVATTATVSLVASPEDFDAFLDDQIRNRAGSIAMGVVAARPGDPGGNDLVAAPVPVFFGTMDGMAMTVDPTENGVQSTMTITLSTGPGARSAATIAHSDADQSAKYPGDTAGRLVALSYARAQKYTWPES